MLRNKERSTGRSRGSAIVLGTAGALAVAMSFAPIANAAVTTPDPGTTTTTTTTTDPTLAAPAADPIVDPALAAPAASALTKPAPTASPAASAAKPSSTGTVDACATAPRAPWRLSAERDATDPTTFVISWGDVGCATRYNVSVFTKGVDDVTVVDGATTSFKVTGSNTNQTYAIQVSSRNDAGKGASTPVYYLRPTTPHGVTGMKITYNDLKQAVLTWNAPTDRKVAAYRLQVTQVATHKVFIDDKIAGDLTETPLAGLDARGMFVITLQALSDTGEGPISRLIIGGEEPNPVKSIGAIRDPGNPKQIIVTWLPSDNTLKGNVIGYEIGYGKHSANERVFVKVTEGKVVIPADASTVVVVRVITDNGKSRWSKAIRVPMDGNRETTTTNPSIDLVEQSGVVTVAASDVVASTYRLVVKIAPTLSNGGFTDTQYSQSGAQTLSFRTVPQGMYVVTVEGGGKELARRYVNVGKAGYMFAGDWKTTLGSPKISDAGIEMPVAGETRVLSTRPRANQDVVISTDAQLTAGDGYGFWFRTSNLEGNKPTGLTFQYDPKWNSSFIVRQWQNGTECGTPIATAKFPGGLVVNGNHRITMAAAGDSMYATLDGVKLFDVPSLSAAMAANKCGYTPPTGTQVGLRKWTTSTVIFKDISVQ